MVDGLRGLHCGFYTWATVKLYYSVFYSLRAALAADRICVFYVKTTPYWISCAVGENGVKGSGTTHIFVLQLFAKLNPTHSFVTQKIDSEPALDWIIAKRLASNYHVARFTEPLAPVHFRHVETYGIRRLVIAYLGDRAGIYTFDKDHAMLSLPLASLVYASAVAKGLRAVRIATEELAVLTSECRDDAGPLTQMASFFRDFAA